MSNKKERMRHDIQIAHTRWMPFVQANYSNAEGDDERTGLGKFWNENGQTILTGGFRIGEAIIAANAAKDIAKTQYGDSGSQGAYKTGTSSSGNYPPPPPAKSKTGLIIGIVVVAGALVTGVIIYKNRKKA